jgi:CarD family transcriptional regulator
MVGFKVGQKVVYPNHGIGTIEQIEQKQIGATLLPFYTLRLAANNSLVLVPVSNATEVGLRSPISSGECEMLFKVFADDSRFQPMTGRIVLKISEKMRTGDIFEAADVLKHLTYLSHLKPLSFREQRMLERARYLVISELAAVCRQPECNIEPREAAHSCLRQHDRVRRARAPGPRPVTNRSGSHAVSAEFRMARPLPHSKLKNPEIVGLKWLLSHGSRAWPILACYNFQPESAPRLPMDEPGSNLTDSFRRGFSQPRCFYDYTAKIMAIAFQTVNGRRQSLRSSLPPGTAGARAPAAIMLERASSSDNPTIFISAVQFGITLASLALDGLWNPSHALLAPIASLIAWKAARVCGPCDCHCHRLLVNHISAHRFGERRRWWRSSAWRGAPSARDLELFAKTFSAPLWILNTVGSAIGRLIGLKSTLDHAAVYTETELRQLIDVARDSGYLRAEERRLIHRVFEFSDTLCASHGARPKWRPSRMIAGTDHPGSRSFVIRVCLFTANRSITSLASYTAKTSCLICCIPKSSASRTYCNRPFT